MKTNVSKTNSTEFVVPSISRSATIQPEEVSGSIDSQLFERIVRRLPELPSVKSSNTTKRAEVRSA